MYLGPDGVECYTQRVSVAMLRETMRICSHCAQDDPHWAGVLGMVLGTDCCDQALEAFHSPWQHQLDTLGKSATAAEVLTTVQ